MTIASTQSFLLVAPVLILAVLVTVMRRSSTLLVSLLIVEIMISLLRKQGMVMAMIESMRTFIVKYNIVPLK